MYGRIINSKSRRSKLGYLTTTSFRCAREVFRNFSKNLANHESWKKKVKSVFLRLAGVRSRGVLSSSTTRRRTTERWRARCSERAQQLMRRRTNSRAVIRHKDYVTDTDGRIFFRKHDWSSLVFFSYIAIETQRVHVLYLYSGRHEGICALSVTSCQRRRHEFPRDLETNITSFTNCLSRVLENYRFQLL